MSEISLIKKIRKYVTLRRAFIVIDIILLYLALIIGTMEIYPPDMPGGNLSWLGWSFFGLLAVIIMWQLYPNSWHLFIYMSVQYVLIYAFMIIWIFGENLFIKFLSLILEIIAFLVLIAMVRAADNRRHHFNEMSGKYKPIGLFFLSGILFFVFTHFSAYSWAMWASKSLNIIYYLFFEFIMVALVVFNIYFMERIKWKS